MRFALVWVLFLVACTAVPAADPKPVKIKKVLVHLLDRDGKHFLSPSLYERDAYQAHLRQNRAEQGGLRFDIHWNSRTARTVTLQVELRGANDQKSTESRLSKLVVLSQSGSRWTDLRTEGEAYRQFGQLAAWRVTVWDGELLLAEQRSFLW